MNPAGEPANAGQSGAGPTEPPTIAPDLAKLPTPDPTDPDLARLVAVWADLPPAIRAGIVAMVKATTSTPPTAPSGLDG